jgi:hypothetical protein
MDLSALKYLLVRNRSDVVNRSASVVSLKFVEEVQTMQRLKSNSNPPVSPFFKGGFFSVDS